MTDKPSLGILLLDTVFPRIPGDVGNELSYDFPVILKTVKGATVQRVIYEADSSILNDMLQAARDLENQGAAAITSSCGFLTVFQEQVAASVRIPVFLSSLLQVHLAYAMTQRRVGIITAHSEKLSPRILRSAGIDETIPYTIDGMQNSAAFSTPILHNGLSLDKHAIEDDIVSLATTMIEKNPDIGSWVFECHNLAPYSQAVQSRTGLPVFDIVDFAGWVYRSINKREFPSHNQSPQT